MEDTLSQLPPERIFTVSPFFTGVVKILWLLITPVDES